MYGRGLTEVVCLLASVGFAAGLSRSSEQNARGALSVPTIQGPTGNGYSHSPSPRVTSLPSRIDVGVSKIASPGEYVPFGDTVIPRAVVKNFGAQTISGIPVICVLYDSASGARLYGPETVFAVTLDSGSVDTVAFPFWVSPGQHNVYCDTMATALPGDEDTSNDWKAGCFTVSVWGEEHLTYNDGTFEYGISWVFAGSQLTERFPAPLRPLTLTRTVLWLTSYPGSDTDYDAEVRVYASNGSRHGYPGAKLGAWVGQLHADTWMSFYKNEVTFDPPVVVNCDTFFVSYYQTSISPPYPCMAMDTDNVPINLRNDWGFCNYQYEDTWGVFPYYDSIADFGIDAYYGGLLLDASLKDITVPQGDIDSNTTFTPQVVVKNAGIVDRNNIPVTFTIIRTSVPGETIYSALANSGPVAAGQEVTVTFPDSVRPPVGAFVVISITLLPFDGNTTNDTLIRLFTVGRTGIADEILPIGHGTSLTITPNPLRRLATVRYSSLPKAGLVTFDFYDVTGRPVMTQTIKAGRHGSADLDLRKLRAGVYTVMTRADGYGRVQKLVVER